MTMNKVTSEIFLFVGLRIWFSEAAVLGIYPFLSIWEICDQVEKNRFGFNLSVETCKVAICDCCFFLIVVFKYLLLVYFRRWGYFCTSQETGIERLLGDAEQLDCFVEIVLSNKMGISQSICCNADPLHERISLPYKLRIISSSIILLQITGLRC